MQKNKTYRIKHQNIHQTMEFMIIERGEPLASFNTTNIHKLISQLNITIKETREFERHMFHALPCHTICPSNKA